MSIISWNCRGSGGAVTIPTLARYLHSTRARLAFVSETKYSISQAKQRISRLSLRNSEVIPSVGKSGGIWLLWDDDVVVEVLERSFFFFFAKVQMYASEDPWLLGAVYAHPNPVVQGYIWDRIIYYSNCHNLPLCTIGDFNCILGLDEKKGGSTRFKSKNRAFASMVHRASLHDLGYSGPAYTWAKHQPAQTLIRQRLDRALANAPWVARFRHARVLHLPKYNSDHAPIFLTLNAKPTTVGESDWAEFLQHLRTSTGKWEKTRPSPLALCKEHEKKMLDLQSDPSTSHDQELQAQTFDKLNWQYIFNVLDLYGLPPNYIEWVRACVTSSRFSIVLNGDADGFIQLIRGVRQGCSLSPYLFIIALDVLSRLLDFMVQKGELKGVTIARGAPTLTTLLYADDLLIFGEASQPEFITDAFAALPVTNDDIYLGTPIGANRPGDFGPLLDKIDSKLQPWKRHYLSQAGKIVLIKSVIEPLLLYTMSTTALPASIIRTIEGKLRSFFWDKGDGARMPLVAWSSITKSKDQGGLGLKDLTAFNKSLHMKAMWAIISKSSATWVSLVKAKYLSRANIWQTQRTRRCTALWRALLGVREMMRDNIKWQIGNGELCGALGEPWHDMWSHFQPQSSINRRLLVVDLLNRDAGTWNTTKLIDVFDFHGALFLAIAYPNTPVRNDRQDRLVFTAAINGQFTIKADYHLLTRPQLSLSQSSQ
ncbi:hypothetical protein LUZ63_017713 [Rhynchospora breviuscula]|uniref:Reverse transcriptase domain-containing protein n=1 Tax=Rhynchospora breviuscula TaxID=2022672 RepID=A0A9Q0HH78_9POAL|nr:hypothetical protein LUZ63_017713 [Rhynchospora breviuscula]